MTVRELIEALEAVEDKEMIVVFLAGVDGNHFIFQHPCPAETGVIEMGGILASVEVDGTVSNLDVAGKSAIAFALMPHNENDPHEQDDTLDSGE